MNIGLYLLKEPFRKTLKWIVPFCKNIHPNTISWSILPVGVFTGLLYIEARHYPELYLLCIALLFLRMILASLDGMLAQTFKKESPIGEILNRFVPEVCDILLIIALIYSQESFKLGSLVLALAWLSSFTGLVGLVANKPIQSIGPLGQTDRLATLMLFSLLEYIAIKNAWTPNFIIFFLYWTIIGGFLTVVNRLTHQYK